MLGIISGRRPLERFAHDRDPAAGDGLPFLGAAHDSFPDLRESRSIRMPEPSSAHAAAGLEMEVEPRSVDVLARGLVRKVRGGGGLVRAFVPRQARVPVNAEHRAADRPRIGGEIPADLAQTRAEVGNDRSIGSFTSDSYRCLFS